MKKTNKIFSVILALALVFAMAIPAFAAGDGKITITNAVKDQTYTIYKMFDFVPVTGGDAESEQGFYTIAEGSPWEAFIAEGGAGAAYLAKDASNGTIVWVGDNTDARKAELAKLAVAYAKANSNITSVSQKATADGMVEFTGLDLGYYAIDSSLGAICGLSNTNKEYELHEKNEGPTLEKKIVEGDDLVDANNVAIGDTVTYQAKIKIGKGLKGYVMHDNMSAGLEYTGVTSVTVDGAPVAEANYTVKTADLCADCDFEIAFDDAYTATIGGKEIIVTYTAELTDAAVVGSTGNPNTAKLEYINETTTEYTPEDIVITYTTKLVVDKVDGEGKPLTGAEFTLTDANNNKYTATVSEDGTVFTWTGLKEGTYTLEETKVPAGYNKAENVTIEIECTEPDEVKSAADTATWVDSSNGIYETTVKNLTGSLLPETGGIGTTIFYIVGALLVVGAAVLLISKKRMACEA